MAWNSPSRLPRIANLILNCATLDNTLASLSDGIGCSREALVDALTGFDEASLDTKRRDPREQMPGDLLGQLGDSIEQLVARFKATMYFHGTRVSDLGVFAREGIRPRAQMLEQLWTMLGQLARSHISGADWQDFK